MSTVSSVFRSFLPFPFHPVSHSIIIMLIYFTSPTTCAVILSSHSSRIPGATSREIPLVTEVSWQSIQPAPFSALPLTASRVSFLLGYFCFHFFRVAHSWLNSVAEVVSGIKSSPTTTTVITN